MDSELIVIGTVTGVKSTTVTQESFPLLRQEDLTIKIKDVLKGSYTQPTISVRRWNYQGEQQSAVQWKNSQTEILFFLTKKKSPHNMEDADLQGNWGLRADFPYGPVDLKDPGKLALYLVSADMQAPKTGEEILKVVRDQLQGKAVWDKKFLAGKDALLSPPPAGAQVLEVPEDSPAYHNLFGGSSVYMIVPAK